MTDVSLIVPIYNVEKYLVSSVEAMLGQTHTNIEIILVDDGSTDGCGKICDSFAEKDSRIKVIHKKNGGVASARNAGMDKANGKYIYFCDPDDIISLSLIYDNFRLMEKYQAEVCVFGYDFLRDEGGRFVKETGFAPPKTVCLDYKGFWDNFPQERQAEATVWCRMFLRELLVKNNIRAKNVVVGEDTLFIYDVYECGFNKIVYNSGKYYSYIRRQGGAMMVYKEGRLEVTYMLAERLKEVVENCDYVKGRYEGLVYSSYVYSASGSFRYLTALSPLKMYGIVKEYMSRPNVKEGFSRLNLKEVRGSRRRVRMFLLKHRLFGLYTAFSYFYDFTKKFKGYLRRG
ncbi:MAG: glycosyltransferase [Clostridiales bacterium]|nr:glycosyltransferase [Clostridiales bacterium]